MSLALVIYGEARPQGSMRAFRVGKRTVVTSDNPHLRGWRAEVRSQAQQLGAPILAGAVALEARFFLPRPVSVGVKRRPYPTVAPDLDKLVRAICDALTGVLWRDDALVVSLSAIKAYTAGPARAELLITEILNAPTYQGALHDRANHRTTARPQPRSAVFSVTDAAGRRAGGCS